MQLFNGYRSVINIAQNFRYAQNKNFNLYTRHNSQTRIVSFPDHEKLLKELDSG